MDGLMEARHSRFSFAGKRHKGLIGDWNFMYCSSELFIVQFMQRRGSAPQNCGCQAVSMDKEYHICIDAIYQVSKLNLRRCVSRKLGSLSDNSHSQNIPLIHVISGHS
jgi:hypothetical protein